MFWAPRVTRGWNMTSAPHPTPSRALTRADVTAIQSAYQLFFLFIFWTMIRHVLFVQTPSLHVLVKFENTVLVFFSELDIDSRKVASRILGFYLVSQQQIYKKENSIVPSSMANFI